jgi:hypothetical protein
MSKDYSKILDEYIDEVYKNRVSNKTYWDSSSRDLLKDFKEGCKHILSSNARECEIYPDYHFVPVPEVYPISSCSYYYTFYDIGAEIKPQKSPTIEESDIKINSEIDSFTFVSDGINLYTLESDQKSPTIIVPKCNLESYPHQCPHCGSPAYVGLMEIDCSNNCKRC